MTQPNTVTVTEKPASGGSMSIETFCRRNEISRSFYYKLHRAGRGPDEARYGAAVRITYAAEAKWLKKGEKNAKTAA
jgi:hypothetical protein